jgi:hypothetical protein
MSRHELPPIHPGEILIEELLCPLGISQYRVDSIRTGSAMRSAFLIWKFFILRRDSEALRSTLDSSSGLLG